MKLLLMLGVATVPLALANTVSAAPAAIEAPAAGEALYGRVADSSGSGLPGAEVVVSETGRRAVTDTQGNFSFIGLEPGRATLTVRYLGLPQATQTVTVAAGSGASIEIVMGSGASDPSAVAVDDIVVVGAISNGAARALNQQRNADGTITVISADAIGRYPDPNVAESLQRAPGVAIERDQGEGRYINVRGAPAAFTAVSVDGVTVPAVSPTTRAVDLDTLPSDIVSNLEVSKSLIPSQDADSIAGAVNIVTRSAFDSRGLRLTAMAGASYNDFGGGSDQRAQMTVSNTFADRTLGALLSVSYSRTNKQPDNVENGWVRLANGNFGLTETLFKDYQTQRTRMAATGALEWRPNDATRAYLRGSFAQFEDDEFRNLTQILWGEGTVVTSTNASATFANTRLERQFRHRTQRNDIATIVAGAEHDFSNFKIDYSLAWSNSQQSYPNRNELRVRSTLRPTLSYSFADPEHPTYSLFNTNEHQVASAYAFRENTFRRNDTEQDQLTGAFNVEIPTRLVGAETTFKFGVKASTRDVSSDEYRARDRTTAATNSFNAIGGYASFLTDTQAQNFDYILGPRFNPGSADAYFFAASATSPARIPEIYTADYWAKEDILAGYGQATFDFGATRVIAGLRVENTKFDGTAYKYNAVSPPPAGTLPPTVDVSKDYTDVFPSLTVRHDFTENLVGRFALTRAINRPEYNQLVPREIDEADGAINSRVTVGNPDLEPTLSNNVDLGLEYYFSGLGVVSINGFYKDLSDYRYILNTTVANTTPANSFTTFVRPENAPEGHITGVEFNWSQKLTFLPGLLSNFGLTANYTWTDAEIELGRTYAGRSKFALPGQSENNYNLSVFYETDRYSARLSYTDRSDYLNEINANDAAFDLYWKGREQLDFTASADLTDQIELFAEAKNLTNAPGVRYYGSSERTYEYEEFGYNVFVGLRFKL